MLRASLQSQRERARVLPFPSARRLPYASIATLLAHRVRPGQRFCPPGFDELVEFRLHVIETQRAYHFSRFLFGGGEGEKFCLQMSTRDRVDLTPPHELPVGSERRVFFPT